MRQNIFFYILFYCFQKIGFFSQFMHEYQETTSQNVSSKIRNKYTKNQNQDWTYF